MQSHREFQIVTPRTLSEFTGKTLILPDVRVMNTDEQNWFHHYIGQGKKLIITGNDPLGASNEPNLIRFPQDPGEAYVAALEKDFEHTAPNLQESFLESLPNSSDLEAPYRPTSQPLSRA